MAKRDKRKRRRNSGARGQAGAGGASVAPKREGDAGRVHAGARKSKDDLAREELVPLREGERPAAVTVAAVVAALLGLSNIVGFLAGVEVGGEKPQAGAVAIPAALMLITAAGMWYARYWAVLGFQTILAFLIVIMSILLVRAENLLAVVVAAAIIGVAGALFWFLVRSLARIQMPERRPPSG
jgi:hypothetical protein